MGYMTDAIEREYAVSCGRYAHFSERQLNHLVSDALLKADPSKARFVTRFEPQWQTSRPALLRLAHLFSIPPGAVAPDRDDERESSPERDWVRLER